MVLRATRRENGAVKQQPSQPVGSTSRRRELNRRLRLAFIAGAEERSLRELGRPLTADELRRVLERYPGDLPER
jgi:hypothetical protein